METGYRPMRLYAALGNYSHTAGLKSGEITSPEVTLNFAEVEPIHRAFAPMARTQAYDVSEMAIVTYLQAKAYNKPLLLLPAVVAARFQQGCIIYNAERGQMTTNDLAGAKVGVRTYSQTTGMWVRAILAETYGVPLEEVDWVTFSGSHLEEYQDPPFTRRAPPDKKLLSMLRSGELDAAILGNDLPDEPGLKPLIPNAAQADALWFEQHRFVPINHMVVMSKTVAQENPRCVSAVYDLLKRGKAMAGSVPGTPDRLKFGIDALRQPMQMILDICERQKLLSRKLTVDEIFDGTIQLLGESAR